MINTKIQICNLALSCIGDKGSVEILESPRKQTEIVCAKWFDTSRKTFLRQVMPNFAKKRDIWALDANYLPAFGYAYAYKYKADCLKVLGIGNLYEKRNDYAVEGGYILTNFEYPNGLPVRYIQDITDISSFTPDAINLFAWFLARDICIELTENNEKYNQITQLLPAKIAEFTGIDSQENKPIRIEHSGLMRERAGLWPLGRKA